MLDSKLKILIIEDEPLIAEDLMDMLSSMDTFQAEVAYTLTSGIDKLAQNNTDFVLLDINLNGQFEGLEIAKVIHEKYFIPFIFITSYADKNTLEKAKVYQPSGYIVKPFEDNEIYAAIEIAWYNHLQKRKNYLSIEELNSKMHCEITPKEYIVLKHLADGKSYKEIASLLSVSFNTVNTHAKNSYSKLGVHSKIEALKILKHQ